VYSDKIPDDGQRNCPKHVEFYAKNKFEKLVHLVGFIIRIYHDAHSPECQINYQSTTVAGYKQFYHPTSIFFSFLLVQHFGLSFSLVNRSF